MIELIRIIENQQVELYSYKATGDEELALQLNELLEITKPKNYFPKWHPLISTPFRYPPPLLDGRFRPPYGKNVFYGSKLEETALYEYTYHLLKQRVHLKKFKPEIGERTLFVVDADDKLSYQISKEANIDAIMDKNNYSESHNYVINNPKHTFIWYPSCRDPKNRENAAIMDVNHLAQNPKSIYPITFFYDNSKKIIRWLSYNLQIHWADVC